MKRYITLLCVVLLSVIAVTAGCRQTQPPAIQEVTFAQLFTDPEQYSGEVIVIEGFYFDGFEVQVIAETLDYSGYAEGHLVPKGRSIWVEGEGIPREVWDQLYKQTMMGPEECYGKVRVRGEFGYGAQYGHGGGYSSQIIPSAAELLEWSP